MTFAVLFLCHPESFRDSSFAADMAAGLTVYVKPGSTRREPVKRLRLATVRAYLVLNAARVGERMARPQESAFWIRRLRSCKPPPFLSQVNIIC